MTNEEYFNKAVKRVASMSKQSVTESDIIIELEKEIERYRDKIMRMEACIDGANAREMPAQLEAVQENTATEIIKALADNGYNTITINCYKDTESEEN